MADIVPYSPLTGMTDYPRSSSTPALTRLGQAQGIYIALHPDNVDETVARFERWFADRDEVRIIDSGTSDKAGLGFILMEWLECDVDQLFLSILDDEQMVADYTLYGRILEG